MLLAQMSFQPIDVVVRDGIQVRAESGRLSVPILRSQPGRGQLLLQVLRFPSTSAKPGHPIVYLAGGPGAAGSEDIRGVPVPVLDSLRSISDVIVLDQRGTGQSEL
ncbi:MAG: hypothetical protein ACREAA_08300 [Candidatus Polarisedimenticolia bacterium]